MDRRVQQKIIMAWDAHVNVEITANELHNIICKRFRKRNDLVGDAV